MPSALNLKVSVLQNKGIVLTFTSTVPLRPQTNINRCLCLGPTANKSYLVKYAAADMLTFTLWRLRKLLGKFIQLLF